MPRKKKVVWEDSPNILQISRVGKSFPAPKEKQPDGLLLEKEKLDLLLKAIGYCKKTFSPRHRQVLELMMDGKSIAEIREETGMGRSTTTSYMAHARRLIRWYIENPSYMKK